jgi:hypothetical protein
MCSQLVMSMPRLGFEKQWRLLAMSMCRYDCSRGTHCLCSRWSQPRERFDVDRLCAHLLIRSTQPYKSDYVLEDDDGIERSSLSDQLAKHARWVERLESCQAHLLSELRVCGDTTVESKDG